ncbi:SGNH/GDSL hydrolase family protein [Alloscardovia venturai]|uniref:SGNH/GDSL hydrolase family protein n=1 Tax=Alloscardovia venturai TaxID=1769421 RepID=A0ABW2YAW5_9BIFI
MSRYALQWRILPGNSESYDVAHVVSTVDAKLSGKTLFVLGSSITFGYGSGGQALGEYLKQRFHIKLIKDAVNGTTLAGDDGDTYVARLKRHTAYTDHPDIFLVQLSTNDVWRNIPLDTVRESIETIVSYIKEQWNVPIFFYTNTYFAHGQYAQTVEMVNELQRQRKDFYVLDLFHDEQLNSISSRQHKLYMLDDIHPTRAGYTQWWGPAVEKKLLALL